MKQHYINPAQLQYKSSNPDGEFIGYASIFNVKDHMNDIVLPGAFYKSLQQNQDIKLLWQHEQKEPIGIIQELVEDERGLRIKGKFLLEVARAREAYVLVKNRAIKGLSIGYHIDDFYYEGSTRLIKAVSLLEVSIVTIPANPQAEVTHIKSMAKQLVWHLEQVRKILHNNITI